MTPVVIPIPTDKWEMTKYHKKQLGSFPLYHIYSCSLCHGASDDMQSMSPRCFPDPARKIIQKTVEIPTPKPYVFCSQGQGPPNGMYVMDLRGDPEPIQTGSEVPKYIENS